MSTELQPSTLRMCVSALSRINAFLLMHPTGVFQWPFRDHAGEGHQGAQLAPRGNRGHDQGPP